MGDQKKWCKVYLKKLIIISGMIFLIVNTAFSSKVTVDADGPADYISLDSVIAAINRTSSPIDPDTILFIGSNQHSYKMSVFTNKTLGTLHIIGNETDPDKFPMISDTAHDYYNFFNANSIYLENITLKGKTMFKTNSAADKIKSFKNCVIKDYTTSFFEFAGNSSSVISFSNCLFTNNSGPVFVLTFYESAAPVLTLTNCTFDSSGAIFSGAVPNIANISIKNCIFNGTNLSSSGVDLSSKVSTSISDRAGFGNGTSVVSDPGFKKTTGRTIPSDWKLFTTSPALDTGTTVGAPSLDIAGQPRLGKIDLGCWELQNHQPTNISLTPSSINENRANGTAVGVLTTADADITAGDTFAYYLYPDSLDNNSFTIAPGSDSLRINFVPDYEEENSFSIRVRSTDRFNDSVIKVLTVTINNLNEAPTQVGLSKTSVNENVDTGTGIGRLTTTDPDAGNTFTYTLSGTDAARFKIRNDSLVTNSVVDYEAKSSLTITVTSTDQGGLAFNKSFTIAVNNINEKPTDLILSDSTVLEMQDSGTVVGTLSASDPEGSSQAFTYSLVSGTGSTDNTLFRITGNTLHTSDTLNYLVKSLLSIRIRVSDTAATPLFYDKVFPIRILSGPKIVTQPRDTVVAVGASASFSVKDTGTTPKTYQWIQTEVPGTVLSTTPTLALTIVDSTLDSTTYSCRIQNAYGTVTTRSAALMVVSAPVITAQPASITVYEGKSASFSVTATGKALTYQWFRNNVVVGTTSNLVVDSVKPSDSGAYYKCAISNIAGTVYSDSVCLSVFSPAKITTEPVSVFADEGDTVQFSVTASGSGTKSYVWLKNGDSTGVTSASMVLTNVPKSDSGAEYSCIVSNLFGKDTSNLAILNIRFAKPKIVTEPVLQNVMDGDLATFFVRAKGSQPLTYSWFRTGVSTLIGSKDTLSLRANKTDSGASFYCIVSNMAGEDTSNAGQLLIGTVAPDIILDPASIIVYEKEDTMISVIATGSEPLTFTWFKNNVAIDGNNNDTLFFDNLSMSDSGALFYCIVKNAAGEKISKSAMLTINKALAAPQVTLQPEPKTVFTGDSAVFKINASGNPLPEYTWIVNGIPTGNSDTLIIRNASYSDNNSRIYCLVSNNIDTISSDTVNLRVELRPRATFTATPSSGKVPLIVDFKATDTLSSITSWRWDFGDGVTVNPMMNTTTHQYNSAGNFDVKLTVTGPGGTDSTTIKNCVVPYVGDTYNPVRISLTYRNQNRIEITLSNLSQIPSPVLTPRPDSLGVWCTPVNLPVSPSTSIRVKTYAIEQLTGKSVLTDTVELSPTDTVYGLMTGIIWSDRSVSEFNAVNGGTVLLKDTASPINSLQVTGSHLGGDSAKIIFSNIISLDTNTIDSVAFWYGTDLTNTTFTRTSSKWFSSRDVYKAGSQFTFKVNSAILSGEDITIWCSVVCLGLNKKMSSQITSSFKTNTQKLDNPIILTVSQVSAGKVELSWNNMTNPTITSMRILKGLTAIPVGPLSSINGYDTVKVSLSQTVVSITGLSASTNYYFAAQVYGNGVWSPVTENSRISVKTLEPSANDSVKNTIKISRASFDELSSTIKVWWCVESPNFDSLQVAIAHSLKEYPTSSLNSQFIADRKKCDSAILKMSDLFFDTTYYISMFISKLESGLWIGPTDSSKISIPIPPFSRQVVTLSGLDTVRAFNGTVKLWPAEESLIYTKDTVRAHQLTTPLSGFIVINNGFYFSKKDPNVPFNIGLKYSSIPAKYSFKDVRMYRDSAGIPIIDYDTKFDTINKIAYITSQRIDLPFMLLIDTVRPVIQISDTGSIAISGMDIVDTLIIKDNVGNVKYLYSYSSGNEKPQNTLTDYYNASTEKRTLVVPSDFIKEDCGVRIQLIVTDGIHSDSVNCSRRVLSSKSFDVSINPNEWNPVSVRSELSSFTPESLLNRIKVNELLYDPRYVRLYRWCSSKWNSLNDEKWVEYSDTTADLFDFIPGRVFWVKTRELTNLSFGTSTTLSLKDTFKIALPPKEWSDIEIPFGFDMYFGDIFESTQNREMLDFYYWAQDSVSKKYLTKDLYVSEKPFSQNLNALLSKDTSSGYTVYNNFDDTITLRIPPTPVAMSLRKGKAGSLTKQKSSNMWLVKVRTTIDKGATLPDVDIGYWQGKQERYYPPTPSFFHNRAILFDRFSGKNYSSFVTGQVSENGISREIAFVNNTDTVSTYYYQSVKIGELPDGVNVYFYSPETKEIQVSGTVRVAAHSTEYRTIIVASDDFVNKFLLKANSLNYSLCNIYPNPCRSKVRIPFTIPFGSKDYIGIEIYDELGRLVWKKISRQIYTAGLHSVTWNGSAIKGNRLSAGVYLIRLSVKSDKGRTVAHFEKRITYFP